MTRRAIPASRKRHGHQGPGGDSVARGAPKRQTLDRIRLTGQECSNGIRYLDLEAATSEEGEDIRYEFQEDRIAGDRKASSRVVDWATGSE
jgi:hypothetical protein